MENRQRTIRKLLWRITAVLAVLAVVSICFVSGTFARYVSNRSGSTVTEVAKWDIDFTTKDGALTTSTFALVNKLSPSMEPFPAATTPEEGGQATVTNREKSSGTVLVLMIENKGDVDATLTITPPADDSLIFYGYAENGTDAAETAYSPWGSRFEINKDGTVTKPSLKEAQAVITMQFALTKQEITAQNESSVTWQDLDDINFGSEQSPLTLKANPGNGETSKYYFYVRSVWTSQDSEYYKTDPTTAAAMSDGLDTWLGENIAALGGEFTFSVVQDSELPGTNP